MPPAPDDSYYVGQDKEDRDTRSEKGRQTKTMSDRLVAQFLKFVASA